MTTQLPRSDISYPSTVQPQNKQAIGCITFNSASDVKESIFITLAKVTWMQPAIFINCLFGFLFHVQVAHEDVPSWEADLPIAIFIWLMDQCPAACHFLSTA